MVRTRAFSGSKPVEVDKDDWHNVSDAKKRKQIQDRLAQRSRRRRLRDVKNRSSDISQEPATLSDPKLTESYEAFNSETAVVEREEDISFDQASSLDVLCPTMVLEDFNDTSQFNISDYTMDQSPSFGDMMPIIPVQSSTNSDSPSHIYSSSRSLPNFSHELPHKLTPIIALYINGEILGLSCCTSIPAKSKPAAPNVPLSLRPTPTQLLTLHMTGTDRLPFPKMRDNIIGLSGLIDEEELGRDIIMMPSFSINPGAMPWDPKAWKVEKPFADKWGFLFC